ncbi:MAG TPA: glycosyltransferase family 4 protein [Chthonomonadaceae bacterium]|nr:glycosyltransferase family 4 protein [Chthonomonadaceae bacterium]
MRADTHPTMDYYALQAALGADILDYSALEAEGNPALVRLMRRAGRDTALAALGYLRRHQYDILFSNGENVGIPLSFLLKRHRVRPIHALIGHRLSPRKKKPFLRALHPQMDAIFLYASTQRAYARQELGIPITKLHHIPFHADHRFYRPLPPAPDAPARLICSAGLEWRDYPTLIDAVRGLDVEVRLGAASPWSKHRNETENRVLPPNVSARRYEYGELRQLYADSRLVVVPLYENDFQAGITTILEAMAMGKAVVTSRTTGQVDTIRDGVNGLYVPPGDAPALRAAIVRLLENPEEAARLGAQARRDLEAAMTLDHWVERIACILHTLYAQRQPCAALGA